MGRAAFNQEVTRQASIIAYVDDFKLKLLVTLMAIPPLLLMRTPEGETGQRCGQGCSRGLTATWYRNGPLQRLDAFTRM